MNIHRRVLVKGVLATGLACVGASRSVSAQPLAQTKILYGFAPGSSGDVACRRIADKLGNTAYSRGPAIVENRPGASGRLALEALKGAGADGATLIMSPFAPLAIYPHIYKRLNYDPVKDFSPVSIAALYYHGIAVGPLVPTSVKTLKDFIAWCKANPDQANYGSPGEGSMPHFVGALLGLNSRVALRHIPYRGAQPGLTDLLGGQLASMFSPTGNLMPSHHAGRLRMLAISSPQRSPFTPDVATFAEQGFPELTIEEWFGFYAPARAPAATVAAANAAINAALKDAPLKEALAQMGMVAHGSTPEQQAASQAAEAERWGPLIKRIGFTADS